MIFLKFSTILYIFSDISCILCFWFLILNKRARTAKTSARNGNASPTGWTVPQSVGQSLRSPSLILACSSSPSPTHSLTLFLSPCFAVFSFSFSFLCECLVLLFRFLFVFVFISLWLAKRTKDNPWLCVCVCVCVFFAVAFDIVFVALCKE